MKYWLPLSIIHNNFKFQISKKESNLKALSLSLSAFFSPKKLIFNKIKFLHTQFSAPKIEILISKINFNICLLLGVKVEDGGLLGDLL